MYCTVLMVEGTYDTDLASRQLGLQQQRTVVLRRVVILLLSFAFQWDSSGCNQ